MDLANPPVTRIVIQVVSQQLGWLDGFQNCLGIVPRLGAAWDPVLGWLWLPASLPMGQDGAEAFWIALPNDSQIDRIAVFVNVE